MTKTLCSKCIFGAEVTSEACCTFDIPNLIKNKQLLSIVDNFYMIDNYSCLYGCSKNQYETHKDELVNIDMYTYAKERAKLKYYLLIDARHLSLDEFKNLSNEINTLEFKPQQISLICNPDEPDKIYQHLRTNINCQKWTAHLFINELSFNDCINTVLDTNLANCGSWCVLFYDASKRKETTNQDLNSLTAELHNRIIINQETYSGVISKSKSLHGLCLNCSVYKFLVSSVSNDILRAISISRDITLSNYET